MYTIPYTKQQKSFVTHSCALSLETHCGSPGWEIYIISIRKSVSVKERGNSPSGIKIYQQLLIFEKLFLTRQQTAWCSRFSICVYVDLFIKTFSLFFKIMLTCVSFTENDIKNHIISCCHLRKILLTAVLSVV